MTLKLTKKAALTPITYPTKKENVSTINKHEKIASTVMAFPEMEKLPKIKAVAMYFVFIEMPKFKA